MTKNEELLLRLEVFKVITEYQIKWLSTSYEIPGLNYQIITRAFPQLSVPQAVSLMNEWVQYETNLNINVYNKVRFNEDTNVGTIMKLKSLSAQLDNNIDAVKKQIEKENPKSKQLDSNSFDIKKNEEGVTITFFNPSWFKRDNVIYLTFEAAKELCEKLKSVL
jgi:hypothetical protein